MGKLRGSEESRLSDEKGLPIDLAQSINDRFQSSIGKMLSVNDNYGSETMRSVILDEVNDLRRVVLALAGRLLRGVDHQGRLQPTSTKHRG